MAYRTRKCASRRKASRRNTYRRKARRGGGSPQMFYEPNGDLPARTGNKFIDAGNYLIWRGGL